jgi:hypothetical protein
MDTYFQVPDDRGLKSEGSVIPEPWPATNAGYRLFVYGDSGKERIGIQLGQTVELEIVGANQLYIETKESLLVRNVSNRANMSGDATVAFGNAMPVVITVSALVATNDKQKISVRGNLPGSTALYAYEPISKAVKAELEVVVGNFENHPGMSVDLIANVCRGSDSLRIHALQRMLNNNQYLNRKDARGYSAFNNGDNIFEQHAAPNISKDPRILDLSCGVVARWRSEQVFEKTIAPDFDWYVLGAIHERLSAKPTDRKQVKYRPARIQSLRAQILGALRDGAAVRAAVVDDPTSITPVKGALVAYSAGGHTVVIVGCNASGSEFLYIDPWGGGSKMEYKGGIAGAKFPGECLQIGKFIVAQDPDRRTRAGEVGDNIIRQHPDTAYTFNYGDGSYLEVVAAPFVVPGR